MHEPSYTQFDEAVEYTNARNAKATDALLDLLCQHHPEQCPQAARDYELRRAIKFAAETPPPAPPPAVQIPTEEDRIAAWVEKQKLMLPPKFRDWDIEASCPSILSIQRAVCKHYNISRTDLVSTRRTKEVIEPRQVAIYLSRKLTTRSLPYIGGKFGGRDHTTALHSVNMVANKMARDAKFAERVQSIQASFAETSEAAE